MKNIYIVLWAFCCLFWSAALVNFIFSLGFSGCDTVACKFLFLLVENGYLIVMALILMPLLTVVFLVRIVKYRPLSKYEISIAIGTLALFLSSATFFTSY